MLKESDNPPTLSPNARTLGDLAGRWWVAHTRARNEKAFAWDLLHRGIGYFLPLVERVSVSGGRKRHVLMPLFPSYVFFCGSEADRYGAMTTNRICQALDVNDQNGLITELSAIEKVLSGQAQLDLYPFAVEGQRCRVAGGPFQGLEGTVVRRKAIARLVLEVGILGQGASLEIDADLLQPLD
jgi:transcription antitermination factor NusG